MHVHPQPYEVQLEPATTGSIFHQCVFLRCARTPAVMDAAWLARQRFGMPRADYMPHLSLLYSDCSDHMRYGCTLAHEQIIIVPLVESSLHILSAGSSLLTTSTRAGLGVRGSQAPQHARYRRVRLWQTPCRCGGRVLTTARWKAGSKSLRFPWADECSNRFNNTAPLVHFAAHHVHVVTCVTWIA